MKSEACPGRVGISFWTYVSIPSAARTKKAAANAPAKL